MTDLTVLMPTFNRSTVLRQTLEALCRVRAGELSIEIVVIDNGSTDDTPQVLREFSSRLPLRQIYEPNAGKSNALNRAFIRDWLGVLLVLDKERVTMSEVYVSGAVDDALSRWFSSRLEEIGLGSPV